MTKRIWKLYKEVRRLRNKVKILEADCSKANNKVKILEADCSKANNKVKLPYDTIQVMIPSMYGFETIMNPKSVDNRPKSEFLMKRMTDTVKIHVMDDLITQGYFRKVRDDVFAEIYEIKVMR